MVKKGSFDLHFGRWMGESKGLGYRKSPYGMEGGGRKEVSIQKKKKGGKVSPFS